MTPPAEAPPPRRPSADRRRIPNLAAMATALRRDHQSHVVRYIAQVDMHGWMVKRLKVGAKTSWYVVLEGTMLTVYKNKSAPPRYQLNVRSTAVTVDVPTRQVTIVLASNAGKERVLRLFIESEEEAAKWSHALDAAVNSDITDYYTFGGTLGSGAYGEVVRATDTRTKEVRAVKIIKRGSNMKSREHLESEMRVMKSISHPNIVKTYQIFDLKRTIYIVMEYLPGGDLFDFVAQHDSLTEAQGSQTMRSIFQAVEYLHRHSIVHRDLKPENILCANDNWPLQIKVTDFGFSSFIDPSGESDTMRTQVGTAYFMAPEIISNQGHGPAVDCWACGVILYTILTGRLPFPGRNTTEYFGNVLKGRPLFPNVLWKGISVDAMSLVKGLLNLDPVKRLTALGALQHAWISSPSVYANRIRRDRSNLHSRRRRLFKARKAIIAVAMANKFKATIPQMVDKVGDGTKKVAGGIGQGVKKTADGIEKGVKKTADGIEKGVKKTADGIEKGVKKTADGIGGGVKKTAEGVKKVGDNIGEGTKKVAEGVGEGTKKVAAGVAGGTKKVADSIGTGVKKTVDGVETSARKVGEGVKKTADGIETGFKKTADGIETGFKKTADGIETGFKKTADGIETGFKKTADGLETGFKKTGEGIKRTVDKVRQDRDRSRTAETASSNVAGGSNTDSTRESGRRRTAFRRRGQGSSSGVSGSEPSRQGDIPGAAVPPDVPMDITPAQEMVTSKSLKSLELQKASNGDLPDNCIQTDASFEPMDISTVTPEVSKQPSSEYYSAMEDRSQGSDATDPSFERVDGMNVSMVHTDSMRQDSTPKGSDRLKGATEMDMAQPSLRTTHNDSLGNSSSGFHTASQGSSNGPNSSRPKLPPLSGLTMGLSDSSRDGLFDPNDSSGGKSETDSLRKTAAILLACQANE